MVSNSSNINPHPNSSLQTKRSEDLGSSVITKNFSSKKFPFQEALSILDHSGKRLYSDHFEFHQMENYYSLLHSVDWPLNDERKKNRVLQNYSAKACFSPDAIGGVCFCLPNRSIFFHQDLQPGARSLDFFAGSPLRYFLHQGRKYKPVRLEDLKVICYE